MAKSKFDFVSVVIVAACILALIFLIYKTINMYNQNKAAQADNTELTDENEEADLYNKDGGKYQFDDDDGEIVTDGDKEGTKTDASNDNNSDGSSNGKDATSGNSSTDEGSSTKYTNSNENDRTNGSNASNTNTRPTTSYSNSSGRYMVVAGSFRQKSNAESHAAKLRRMGYDETAVSIFNKGAYASVLVDRFGDRSDANSLARELETKGVEALVITKK